jgi:hypothetical protein
MRKEKSTRKTALANTKHETPEKQTHPHLEIVLWENFAIPADLINAYSRVESSRARREKNACHRSYAS